MQNIYTLAIITVETLGIIFLLVLVYKVRKDLKMAYKQFYRILINDKEDKFKERENDNKSNT